MEGRSEARGQLQAQGAPRGRSAMALPAALGAAVAVLFAMLLALVADGGAPSLALFALLGAGMLAGAAALGWHVGVVKARASLGAALREARDAAQVHAQLQRDWQWATDAEHHLVRWQAPQGAPASSWVGHAATQKLAERFRQAAAVSATLARETSFAGLAVSSADGAAHYRLRGVACRDAAGRFSGYHGAAEVVAAPAELATQAATSPPDTVPPAAADDAFAYLVSHDLRAPLRVAEGFTRILAEDYAASGRPLDALGADHLARVGAAVARMQQMIDALLALTRLGAVPLSRERVDLSRLAADIVAELRGAAPTRRAEVHIEPQLVAAGDPALLRALLENLLGNAWKYSAAAAPARIRFELGAHRGRPCYIVSDNGAGFDMAQATRLFEPFQRLHAASEFPGHGVGLASVRRIVERHGGTVWAEAERGVGARLYFTLDGADYAAGDGASSAASSRAAC